MGTAFRALLSVIGDLLCWLGLSFRSTQSIEAENLFLRRQLAMYVERVIKPRRIDPITRIQLAFLSRFCNWRDALVVVRPETIIRWHRAGWRLYWHLKSRPRRPCIPGQVQDLIRRMGSENPTWGEERIANELLLKLGIQVSPRTVRKYLPPRPPGWPRGGLRWSTFLRLHAQGIIACDFMVVVTATFRMLYVFVVIEHGRRRLAHFNVTAPPTAAWTLQQLRETIGFDARYQYVLHDRNSIFAAHLDESVSRLGVEVSRSPQRSPKANTICERVIGTLRRECLDWVILWGANSSTVARGLTYEHSALKVVPARSTSTMRVFASSCSPASIKRLASRSMTNDYIGQHCVRNLRVSVPFRADR